MRESIMAAAAADAVAAVSTDDEDDDGEYPWSHARDPRLWIRWFERVDDHSDEEFEEYAEHVSEWMREKNVSDVERRQWRLGFRAFVSGRGKAVDLLERARQAELRNRKRRRAPLAADADADRVDADDLYYHSGEEAQTQEGAPAAPPLSRRRILCGELPSPDVEEGGDDEFPHDSIDGNDMLLEEYNRVVTTWLGEGMSIQEHMKRWFDIDMTHPAASASDVTSIFQMEERFTHVFEAFILMRIKLEERDLHTPERRKLLDRVHIMMDHMLHTAKSVSICRSAHAGTLDRYLRSYTTLQVAETSLYRNEAMSSPLRLANMVLNEFLRRGIRRDGKVLYEPIEYGTVAYKRIGTIDEFLWRFFQFTTRPVEMSEMVKHNAVLQNILRNMIDPRLPNYVPDRMCRGFQNGFYMVEQDKATFYEDAPGRHYDHVASHYHGDLPSGSGDAGSGKHSRGQAAFLRRAWFEDVPILTNERGERFWQFNDIYYSSSTGQPRGEAYVEMVNDAEHPPPYHIPTPAVEQFMRTQQWGREKRMWFYIMLGRLLYRVSQKDQYQVVMLVSGASGAGKSTIMNHMQFAMFPDQLRIAVLSSNKEKTFGLQEHYLKDLIICDEMDPEAAKNWSVADFKSMATNGWMSIAIKYMGPAFIRWSAPLILSSNYITPGWEDSTGAVSRRILGFHCEHKVTRDDPFFEDRLRSEGAALLVKANKFYLYALRVLGRSNVHRIIPVEMQEFQQRIERDLAPFFAFLNDPDATVNLRPGDKRVYCRMQDMKDAFREWCNANSVKVAKNKNDDGLFDSVMRNCGMTKSEARMRITYPRDGTGMRVRAVVIYGFDVARVGLEQHDLAYTLGRIGRVNHEAVTPLGDVRDAYEEYVSTHNAKFSSGWLPSWDPKELDEALEMFGEGVSVAGNGAMLMGFELRPVGDRIDVDDTQ